VGSLTCDWCEERFEPFLDDALSAGERARLLGHVDDCDACRGLLEELRVVDALLLEPRTIELPENFTFATMADVHAMPLPCARRAPIAALLAAYIAGAWSLVGAAFLIIPQHMTAFVQHTLAVTSTVLAALGGIGHVFAHLGDRGDMSSWTTVAGGVILADALVVVAVVAALRFVRPRIVERLRW
jgi:anti-sigma factor RsiW